MKRLRHVLALVLIGGGLCVATTEPALAGYGNHAERATANIQTRVGLAKVTLLTHVGSFKVVEARGGLPQPQP